MLYLLRSGYLNVFDLQFCINIINNSLISVTFFTWVTEFWQKKDLVVAIFLLENLIRILRSYFIYTFICILLFIIPVAFYLQFNCFWSVLFTDISKNYSLKMSWIELTNWFGDDKNSSYDPEMNFPVSTIIIPFPIQVINSLSEEQFQCPMKLYCKRLSTTCFKTKVPFAPSAANGSHWRTAIIFSFIPV